MGDTLTVTCQGCGNESQIMAPHPSTDHPETGEQVEVRWLCDDPNHGPGGYANVEAGHPGEPGEAAINPAATGLTDDEVLEAAVRRGLVTEGQVAAPGETTATPTEGGSQS